jgi:hypothetical protein
MGENVPNTSYLSQKEHSFITKCNFFIDLNLLKIIFFACKCRGLKTPPWKKSWLEHCDLPCFPVLSLQVFLRWSRRLFITLLSTNIPARRSIIFYYCKELGKCPPSNKRYLMNSPHCIFAPYRFGRFAPKPRPICPECSLIFCEYGCIEN